MSQITIKTLEDGKIALYTPYHPDFVAAIKSCGARWDGSLKAWTISKSAIESARRHMRAVYGVDDLDDDATAVVTVRVTMTSAYESDYTSSLVMYGHVIASASGRDTGARIGDGVAFISKKPGSGGSVKNWRTTIPAGAIFEVYDVPEALVERGHGWSIYGVDPCTIEVIRKASEEDTRSKLLEERERLSRRISEIDAELEALDA
ncbi:MAG: hypothetical protein LBD02_01370 [Christensenellaceae bacterium]|jgi:hypothetical protein|nr:hypothetical protein [Christensenellaceae bacterium]